VEKRTNHHLPKNVLISASQIASRVKELASEISEDLEKINLIALVVMQGSFIFAADLLRALSSKLDLTVDFIFIQSYGASTSPSEEIAIVKDVQFPIHDKDILVIEDIVDTGATINFLRKRLLSQGARSIHTVTLLEKMLKAPPLESLDYVGFRIPDVFVVGYGLDLAQRYRALPDIRVVDRN